MCGIVGIFGDITAEEEKLFKNLLVVDSLRGMDSTGCAIVSSKGAWSNHKALGDGANYIRNEWDKVVDQYKSVTKKGEDVRCFLGHNRYATIGAVDRKTAQPFHVKGNHSNIILAHNGTLTNFIPDQYRSDSHWLTNQIADKGIEEVYPKVWGAMALAWIDVNKQTLYLARNRERPLHIIFNQDHSNMFFVSEPWMVRELAHRQGYLLDETLIVIPHDLLTVTFDKKNGVSYEKTGLTPVYTHDVTYINSKHNQYTLANDWVNEEADWVRQYNQQKDYKMGQTNRFCLPDRPAKSTMGMLLEASSHKYSIKEFINIFKKCVMCEDPFDRTNSVNATPVSLTEAACNTCKEVTIYNNVDYSYLGEDDVDIAYKLDDPIPF